MIFTKSITKFSLRNSYKSFGKNLFADIPLAPVDPILGINDAFKADKNPLKMNLGVGAYRTEQGKPLVFDVVKKVEQQLVAETVADKINKEYISIDGLPLFNELSKELVFGKNASFNQGVTSTQSLSGTGALRVGFEFIRKFMPNKIHFPNPTWVNHMAIATSAGLQHGMYPYWHAASKGLDFEGMMNYLNALSPGEVVLLHPIAHNPTGVDPSFEQWKQIADLMQKKALIPFLDTAYQGYASGCLEADAAVTRYFANKGFQMFVAQSYAKNLGLYGERVGALHVVSKDTDSAARVLSQVKIVIRTMYSNPPTHGARIAERIMGNEDNYAAWRKELKEISLRVQGVRKDLKNELIALRTPGNWDHVTNQIGMFSYTGLGPKQVENMIKKHSVYMASNGRISLSGINQSNVKYLANAIHDSVSNF